MVLGKLSPSRTNYANSRRGDGNFRRKLNALTVASRREISRHTETTKRGKLRVILVFDNRPWYITVSRFNLATSVNFNKDISLSASVWTAVTGQKVDFCLDGNRLLHRHDVSPGMKPVYKRLYFIKEYRRRLLIDIIWDCVLYDDIRRRLGLISDDSETCCRFWAVYFERLQLCWSLLFLFDRSTNISGSYESK